MQPLPTSSLLHVLIIFAVSTFAVAEEVAPDAIKEPEGELTLPTALSLALERHPSLSVFEWDIRAAEARALQAGLRPNPELALELEDVRIGSAGTSSDSRSLSVSAADGVGLGYSGSSESSRSSTFGDSEITLTLSQLVELGGKRAKRVAAADRERDVVAWDYEVARADVLAVTAQFFYGVLAAQERVRLATHLMELAKRSHDTITLLVDAGKVSAIEQSRSQVELSQIQIEGDKAQRELAASRIELAGQWASTAPVFSAAVGDFPEVFAPPTPEVLLASVENSPYMTRWVAELELRDAVLALERANAKPDLTVEFGLRSAGVSGTSERSWDASTTDGFSITRGGSDSDREARLVLGVSVPLPLFNRNQGSIKEAEHLIAKTADERRAALNSITTALTAGYERATAAFGEIQTLQASVIPFAQEAFDAVQEGYVAGKFALLDVLLAQRALFDAQRQLAEAQAAFQQTIVEIERFTGMPVAPVAPVPVIEAIEQEEIKE